MEVAAAVGEGGEQEAALGQSHHPVPHPVAEGVFRRIIGQAGLGELHRADAGEQVFVDFIGGVLHVNTVRGSSGNVIHVVNHQDQIISHELIVGNDLVIEFLQQLVVLELAVPEAEQEFLGAALLLAF